ncbi:MAG TPA: AMP-binding protein, partial [candidate division Zixibacteria bacterium]|nr:AMP-binding protein [candidate division Zixibacteria bacterium]
WLVSALQVGAAIVLYEGSPAYPNLETLWRMAAETGVSVFGASPKFYTGCQKAGVAPGASFDLGKLKAVLSTGSPLTAENFRWVYDAVKRDVQLSSISGGTDIISCFMLGAPMLPVYPEEIQCRGLGMKVEAFSDRGDSLSDQVGELVCTAPFPSAPVGFWNDPDGSRYHEAYFTHFPGVWRHGDFIKITPRGGVIVYGRSDATLNPGGVRIGTAEIYNPVEALDEVLDSVVVGQRWNDDVRVVLFVALADGVSLDDSLRNRIREAIRAAATPRHVPALILQVNEIPHTISGKKVEIAVTRMIHGEPVGNRDALANPDSLDQFANIPQLRV